MKNVKLIAVISLLAISAGIFTFLLTKDDHQTTSALPVHADNADVSANLSPENTPQSKNTGVLSKDYHKKTPTENGRKASGTNTTHAHVDTTSSNYIASAPAQLFTDPKSLVSNPNGILLQRGGFDTSLGQVELPETLKFDPKNTPPGIPIRYLVQFSGPVITEWKKAVENAGGLIGNYIPNNTFIVSMTSETKDSVAQLSFVQWIDYYHPAYKISKDLIEKNANVLSDAKRDDSSRSQTPDENNSALHNPSIIKADSATTQTGSGNDTVSIPENILLTVQTFENGKLPALYSLVESTDVATVVDSSDSRKSRVLIEVFADSLDYALELLSQSQDIEWIEPYVPPTLNNDTMHWVVQSNVSNENPLWDKGLTGAGQIVGVGDTGLDVDMAFFWDGVQGIPTSTVNNEQRKVLSYHDLAGNGDWDAHDHGTHVAGTIAGKSLGPNASYNGVAYDAKLVIQDIGYGGSLTGIPNDLNPYFQQAYNDGARIHSNSWGAAVGGAYTSMSQDADEFMWNHKDFLIVFSAGNSGSAVDTIGSPGTAKNVLTSGASENAHAGYNQEDVAYFSSNGPTDDGRIKPTVTAPGHYISSANSDGNITTFNSDIRTMSGTSMSAPAHAGSATLVRQYFVEGYYPSGSANGTDSINPSAALVKAILVNSAVNMTGEYTDGPIPSTGQGWGRILLDNTLLFSGDSHTLYVDDNHTGLNTSEEKIYTFYASGNERVKISLTWTDYFPSLSSAIQLVNDLDLIVDGPKGTLLGNVFANGVSTSGGNNDRLNVLENILIPDPIEGIYTVTIRAHNVPNGPQPFALVATGVSSGSSVGTISFDKQYYQPGSTAILTVTDLDLDITDGLDTAIVKISSTNDTGQDIVLTETTVNSGSFKGSFIVESVVQVAEGDTLTASYFDADSGAGSGENVADTAEIDITYPTIANIQSIGISHKTATVTWTTNEKSTSVLLYRVKGDTEWTEKLSASLLDHTIQLENLTSSTSYEFLIQATDQAGNTVLDDNNGQFYTFFTDIEYVFWSDTAEVGSTKFALTGGSNTAGENGLWHVSDYYGWKSEPTSWYYGLESTYTYETGYHNWGHITTVEPIDLQGLESAELRFKHYLKTEKLSYYDTARVQISEDNVNFTTLYQSVYSATFWEEVQIDLSSYVGKSVYIRFYFDTVDGLYNNYMGWLVDDIEVVTFIPDDGIAPSTPVNPIISDPGDTSLNISWDANIETDLAGYNIYRNAALLNTVLVTGTSYRDTDTVHGTDYSYEVTAVDKSGKESPHSSSVSATAGKPGIPTGVTSSSGNTEVTLSWNANNEADLQGYFIYTADADATSDDVALQSAGASVISNLTSGSKAALIDGVTTVHTSYGAVKWPGDFILDLGKVVNISGIGIHNYDKDSRYQRYTVAASVDNSTFTQVIDRSGGQNKGYLEDDISPVVARFIKIRALFNSVGPNVVLKEIKVFPQPFTKINTSPLMATTLTIPNLTNGENYSFAVGAVDSFGNTGALSDPVNGVPDDGIAPLPPVNPGISDPGDTSLNISWDANIETDLAGYNIYRNAALLNTVLVTGTSYRDTDTVYGTDYSYEITAVDKSGKESPHSSSVSATVGKPGIPTGITSSSGNTQVTLSWNANNEADLQGYFIYTADADATSYDVALQSAGASVISNLTSGSKAALIDGVTTVHTSYGAVKWPGDFILDLGKVVNISGIGLHNYDKDSRYQRYTVAASVDNSTYTQVIDRSGGQNKGYLEDDISPVVARFIKIRALFNSVGPNVVLKEIKVFPQPFTKINTSPLMATTLTIPNLTNGENYSFAVGAVDSFGNTGALSDPVNGVPDDGIAPLPPVNPGISDPGDTSLNISWDANIETDLAGYNIYRNAALLNTVLVTGTSYRDTDTVYGTDYSYEITAVDKSGKESPHSSSVSATVGKPGIPTGITSSSGNTQVTLSWNANNEADLQGYFIYTADADATSYDVALQSAGASVISNLTSGSKAALIDGVTTVHTSYGAVKWPGDFILDLGKVVNISGIGLHNYDKDSRYQRYTVAASVDNSTYTQVIDRSGGQNKSYLEDDISPVEARFIKIRALFNSVGPNVVFKEIKVFSQPFTKINTSPLTTTTLNIPNLTNGENYSFAVGAVDSFGNTGALSDPVNGVPDDGIAPAPPVNPGISDPGDTSLNISWNANIETDLAGYNIYRNAALLNTALVTGTSYRDTDTVNGTDYSYEITAVDKSGKESPHSSSVSATAGKPGIPTGVTSSSGNTQVTLSWNANNEADLQGYFIYTADADATSDDVALQSAGASVISNLTSGSKAALIDGVTTVHTSYGAVKWPGDFILDLGKVVNISGIGLHNYDKDSRYQRYTVAASVDNSAYTQVIDRSGGQNKGYLEDDISPVEARFIKIRALFNSVGPNVVFKEIKVFPQPFTKINTSPLTATTFTVSGLSNGTEYSFAVGAVDSFNNVSKTSDIESSIPVLDTDGDNIPDEWEVSNGLDPNNPFDGSSDSDGDGLSNFEEYQNNMDPLSTDTDSDGIIDYLEVFQGTNLSLQIDSDNDGLSDNDETILYKTDPFDWDSDNDMLSDLREIVEGTDPNRYSPINASPDPVFDYYTWTLPKESSPVKLGLPANSDDFVFNADAGITGFGVHLRRQIKGMDYVWFDLKANTPIFSWADGIVNDITVDDQGLYTITIDYGSNLTGWHASISDTNLSIGQAITQGMPIGFGMNREKGSESSAFGLIDAGRTDGPAAIGGGVLVSPFDYLSDKAKVTLINVYKRQVIDKYDPSVETSLVWGFSPYQPYLTNKLMLHKDKHGMLSGVWQIAEGELPHDPLKDILTFIESDGSFLLGNVVFGINADNSDSNLNHIEGPFDANYSEGTVTFPTIEGVTYTFPFIINEATSPTTLTIKLHETNSDGELIEKRIIYHLVE
ncbi:discoidin domain-containing protein [Desulfosediminicola flagellatus]|uniref:discoidin domain-containing protein n=1 Tax=Desulfosediminicola flagellatus TaxID=2569541 RepID=UPI0015935AB0|nr:discoidin domain-containing protein [Desulfosediminicola flagellatus]